MFRCLDVAMWQCGMSKNKNQKKNPSNILFEGFFFFVCVEPKLLLLIHYRYPPLLFGWAKVRKMPIDVRIKNHKTYGRQQPSNGKM